MNHPLQQTAQGGDGPAVGAWVRRHQAAPWRFLRLCGCPVDVADDLVQEALLAALHKGVHAQPDDIAARWLRGAVTNLWRMHLRSSRVRGDALATFAADLELAEYAYGRCADVDGGEAWRAALRQCLQRVEGTAREALRLRYENDLSREELSTRLGLGIEGVKALLRRTRERLRDCVVRRIGGELAGGAE
jgi:RNA polymerase sigma-70 factor (ECF subfamily)